MHTHHRALACKHTETQKITHESLCVSPLSHTHTHPPFRTIVARASATQAPQSWRRENQALVIQTLLPHVHAQVLHTHPHPHEHSASGSAGASAKGGVKERGWRHGQRWMCAGCRGEHIHTCLRGCTDIETQIEENRQTYIERHR